MAGFTQIDVENYRCLAKVSVPLGPINVFFGPNGAGKSTLLNAIWFLHEVGDRGSSTAMRLRGQGTEILWDGGTRGQRPQHLAIRITVDEIFVETSLVFAGGALVKEPGETLSFVKHPYTLAKREEGTRTIDFMSESEPHAHTFQIDEPSKTFLDNTFTVPLKNFPLAKVLVYGRKLRNTRFFDSRRFSIAPLQQLGSPSDGKTDELEFDAGNLWAVLRNLHDTLRIDERYNSIDGYMRKAFPKYDGLAFQHPSPSDVYCLFREKDRIKEIRASAVPDGYLQMLILLTALFSNSKEQESVILFDEPDLSLHPWALFVLAEAIEEATTKWNRQVLLATHSPVLLSQFPEESLFLMMPKDGATTIERVSEMTENRDLLNQYAVGSLYMSQLIGEQSSEPMVHVVETKQ